MKSESYCRYVRVSTKDQEARRTYENQIDVTNRYAEVNKLTISDTYRDTISGKSTAKPEFNKMMKNIHKYKGVIVAFIDRLGRDFVEQLRTYVSLYDSGIEIHIADFGELEKDSLDHQFKYIIDVYFSAKELSAISKRIKLGIKRYKEKHGRWGPKKKKIDLELYKRLEKQGLSKTAISRVFNISRTTLNERLKEEENKKD